MHRCDFLKNRLKWRFLVANDDMYIMQSFVLQIINKIPCAQQVLFLNETLFSETKETFKPKNMGII
jgi:hypothetical protein